VSIQIFIFHRKELLILEECCVKAFLKQIVSGLGHSV